MPLLTPYSSSHMEKCDTSDFSRPRFAPVPFATPFRQAVAAALLATLPIGCATTHTDSKPVAAPVTTAYIPAVSVPEHAISNVKGNQISKPFREPDCIPASQISYIKVRGFHEGVAVVQDENGFLFIDSAGNPISEERFDYANSFYKGCATVQKNGEHYCVDRQMNRVERPEDESEDTNTKKFGGLFESVGEFSDGLATATISGNSYFIDTSGNIAFQKDPKLIYSDFSEGFSAVSEKNGRKAAHVNKSGHFIYPDMYDSSSNFHEGLAAVANNQDWFHIRSDGSSAYQERFNYVSDFENGMAAARKADEWFHIRPDGSPAYEKRYDRVGGYNDELAVDRLGNQWFHIGRSGTPYPARKNCPKK